jgi:hypothetical protein
MCDLSPASCARTLARNIGIRGSSSARHSACHLLAVCCNRFFEIDRLSTLRGRGVPVVYHLQEEDEIQREARNEAVQNERVINFLKRGEDARERAEEVVDNLSSN